jgi:hypothetical protein
VKPCLNCTKRGQPESCDYVKQDSSPPYPVRLQDRVRQLEDMVMTLLNSQTIPDQKVPAAGKSPSATALSGPINDDGFAPSAVPSPNNRVDPNVPKASPGKFTRTRDQANFVGGEHWEAILEDIAELKFDLEPTGMSERVDFKPQILFGTNHASRFEIMSSIPPRPVCDLLISRWFKTMDMASSKFIVI